MKVEMTRTGAPASARARKYGNGYGHAADTGWRDWALAQAQDRAVELVPPLVVTFTPTARDRAALCKIESSLPASILVLEGLVAGAMLTGKRDELAEIKFLAPRVTGSDGMVVRIADAREPF